jgi:hypothetical protein
MFNTISIKIPEAFITEIKKSTLKFISKYKAKAKESNTGGLTIPYFDLYYRFIAIKTAWY